MKILVLSELYPPYYQGGYEINCEVKVKGLEALGHESIVLTSTFGVGGKVRDGNVFRYMYPLAPETGSRMSRRLAQLKNACLGRTNYRIAKKVARMAAPDLVYIWRMGNVSLFPVFAVCGRNVPVVYELGDYWLLEYRRDFLQEGSPLKRRVRKALFGGYGFDRLDFSNMIMVSHALKRSYLEGQFPNGNITVIPAGVFRESVSGENSGVAKGSGDVFRALFAGRIVAEKGVHIAVRAVRRLLDTLPSGNLNLDIIGNGNGEYIRDLEGLIHSLGLRDHVKIRSQISHGELMDEYANYDVFLFPSIWEEPLGMTIIESMAKGVPVVASRVGGVVDIIDDGVNGLLVAPNDPVELAGAVRRLLEDAALCSSIREAGKRTVLEKFDYEKIIWLTEKYLADVAGRHVA